MSSKSQAQLLIDILADITSQVNPESITPAILGARLADIVDSAWNRTDWDIDSLTIPTCLTGQIPNPPRSAQQIIQLILDQICLMSNGNTNAANQGRPGLFLAYVGTIKQNVDPDSNSPFPKMLFTNDFENGGFDNGNNWSTFNYKVPAGGFNGKIYLSSVEMEFLDDATGVATVTIQMLKNGSAVGMPSVLAAINGTEVAGDKIYFDDIVEDFSSAVLVAGDTISFHIEGSTANEVATLRINSGSVSNED